MALEAMDVCLRVLKESNESRFDSYSVRKSVLVISHFTFVACSFSHNLSRNSCMFCLLLRPRVRITMKAQLLKAVHDFYFYSLEVSCINALKDPKLAEPPPITKAC